MVVLERLRLLATFLNPRFCPRELPGPVSAPQLSLVPDERRVGYAHSTLHPLTRRLLFLSRSKV